jgi:alkaline phosphatase
MMISRTAKQWLVVLFVGVAAMIFAVPSHAEVKNVILMIADGSGFNAWNAASMYQGKWDQAAKKSRQVYDGPGWVSLACCTFSLNMSKTATKTGAQDPAMIYDPAKAWDPKDGYEWLKSHYTDSAAAASALSTGHKTYNHAINWSDLDTPLTPTMSEAAKSNGKSAGVITTVPWSHATPAGLSNAHSAERDAYGEIARQMVEEGVMDVIMGGGNPDFDANGQPFKAGSKKGAKAKSDNYKYVGGAEVWKAIETARSQPGGTYKGFRPVSTKAEFEALLKGPTPNKVLGTVQVAETLQQSRDGKETSDPAKDTPLNAGLPDLALMAKGALRVLANNPKGFFLLVEGGAVDWANHKNQPGRMIQEQSDYVHAVEAVVEWVNTNSSWDETLVILTADHETGLLWGPESDTKPFDPIVDNGPGRMPGLKYHVKTHTNSLVPVYARGKGSELLAGFVAGKDPVRGPYVDNTMVAKLLLNAVADKPIQ